MTPSDPPKPAKRRSPRPPIKLIRTQSGRRSAFLALMVGKLTIGAACTEIGITRETYYQWCKADPVFKAAAEEAIEQSVDAMIEEVKRQAMTSGDLKIAMRMIAAHRPQYAQDRSTNVHVTNEAPKVLVLFDEVPPLPAGYSAPTLQLEAPDPVAAAMLEGESSPMPDADED